MQLLFGGSRAAVIAFAILASCSSTTASRTSPNPVAKSPSPGPSRHPHDHSEVTERQGRTQVARALARLGLQEKIGQLLWPYAFGESATKTTPAERLANRALYDVSTPAELVRRYHLGGLVYIDRNPLDAPRAMQRTHNLSSPEQIARLSEGLHAAARADTGIGLLLATDQEGGRVSRVGPPATQFPAPAVLGRTRRAGLAYAVGRAVGNELRALGITVDFAPVADTYRGRADSIIGDRSFGNDPQAVARLVAAQVRGLASARVAATAKHFPGHGGSSVDSHLALPVIRRSRSVWSRLDRPPFASAIAAGVPMVMTAHVSMPALDPSGRPATLSRPITSGLLRRDLGFEAVVVTDALWMRAVRAGRSDGEVAVEALRAGADVLLMPPNPAGAVRAITAALASGRLSHGRLDASVARVLRLKASLGVLVPPEVDPARARHVVGRPEHRRVAEEVLEKART